MTATLAAARLGRMDAPEPDEALMTRYRNGDAAAFDVLYHRHRGGLYRFVLRQVTSKALADELYQDIWMKLIDARDRYEPTARFTTWLYRMARNRVIDHYRRSAVRIADDGRGETDPDSVAGGPSSEPERQAELDGAMASLAAGVANLPEPQRTAFLLREEGGLDLHQIAEVTGVMPETAKSRLRYALAKLRKALEAHHD
ncbi:MAG: RNA polymerase sigma factor [Pseudomonadota bacterium]